jgi:4-amino-4-deoxy-L-arabinose transferase-like glycosyltransferase
MAGEETVAAPDAGIRPLRWPLAATLLRHESTCVLVLTIVAAALRCFRLDARSLNLDEGFSFFLARANSDAFWSVIGRGELNMALYYFLLRSWGHIAGGEFGLRLLSALFGTLSVPVSYLLGRRIFGRESGMIAAMLLALHPFAIRLAQTARSYSLVVLLVMLSGWFLVELAEEPSRQRATGYALTSAAAVYSHFFAVLVLAAHALAWPLVPRRLPRRLFALSFGLLAVLLLPLLAYLLRAPSHNLEWVAPLSTAQLESVLYSLTLSKARSLIYVAAWGFGLYAISRERTRDRRWRNLLVVLWLVLPIAFAAAVSVVRPMLVERYLAVCLPASMLLAARGVAALASWTRAAAIALLLLMVFNSASAIGFYYRHPEYDENWRAAILHVLDNVQPGDEIVIDPYSRFTFDFYSGQRGFRSSALNFSGDLTSAVAHDPAPSQIWLVARKNSQSQVDEFLRRQHRYCQPVEPFLTYDLRAWRFIPCESK